MEPKKEEQAPATLKPAEIAARAELDALPEARRANADRLAARVDAALADDRFFAAAEIGSHVLKAYKNVHKNDLRQQAKAAPSTAVDPDDLPTMPLAAPVPLASLKEPFKLTLVRASDPVPPGAVPVDTTGLRLVRADEAPVVAPKSAPAAVAADSGIDEELSKALEPIEGPKKTARRGPPPLPRSTGGGLVSDDTPTLRPVDAEKRTEFYRALTASSNAGANDTDADKTPSVDTLVRLAQLRTAERVAGPPANEGQQRIASMLQETLKKKPGAPASTPPMELTIPLEFDPTPVPANSTGRPASGRGKNIMKRVADIATACVLAAAVFFTADRKPAAAVSDHRTNAGHTANTVPVVPVDRPVSIDPPASTSIRFAPPKAEKVAKAAFPTTYRKPKSLPPVATAVVPVADTPPPVAVVSAVVPPEAAKPVVRSLKERMYYTVNGHYPVAAAPAKKPAAAPAADGTLQDGPFAGMREVKPHQLEQGGRVFTAEERKAFEKNQKPFGQADESTTVRRFEVPSAPKR